MAERVGFEPTIRGYRIHTFQACAFDHSATAPHANRAFREGSVPGQGRLPPCPRPPKRVGKMRQFGTPPTITEFEAIARAAMDGLPSEFTDHLGDVVFLVEDFADEDTLKEMGMEDPFELTGLYEGIPLSEQSVEHSGVMPPKVRLFRRPILDEWADNGEETLEHLIRHVMIHELGHHFGLSDEDMHALEEQA